MRAFAPALIALLACSGLDRLTTDEAPVAVPTPDLLAPTPAAPTPAAAPPPAVPLPPYPVEGVPGWLGATIAPAGSESDPARLTLAGTSPIVVLSEAWSGVPSGMPLRRVDQAGEAPATFVGVGTTLYGCDGGHELTVANFAGSSTDPLVWLVPPGVPAEPVALQVADTDTTRTWTAGGQTLTLRLTAPDRIELVAPDGKTVLHLADLATMRMGGDEDSHLDLRSSFLVPQLTAAWRVAGTVVVAGQFASYEGDHYVVYALGAVPAEVEVAYLYRCAF